MARLTQSYGVNRVALAAFASGLAGALLGSVFGAWAVRNEPRADVALEPAATHAPDLVSRVEALELALANVEPRVRVLAESDPSAVVGATDVDARGVVFEATVIDLVGKPQVARDPARTSAREREERDRFWAQELTMQLGLTPAQTERLRSIQAELQRELAGTEGMSADRRLAARRALQQGAEQQLRSSLAPRQLDAYEALDARLKLYAGAN